MTDLKMKYFVINPAGDDIYASASRSALIDYARVIKKVNPRLARSLEQWACDEDTESCDRRNEANTNGYLALKQIQEIAASQPADRPYDTIRMICDNTIGPGKPRADKP